MLSNLKKRLRPLRPYQGLIAIVLLFVVPALIAQVATHYSSRSFKNNADALFLIILALYATIAVYGDIRTGRCVIERYGMRATYTRTENPSGFWAMVIWELIAIAGFGYLAVRLTF